MSNLEGENTLEISEIETQTRELSSNLRGFIFFWGGQLISILGSSIVQFVLTWWITIETESPLLLSLSMFIGFFPTILLTPIAGVFVDRWSKKWLMGSTDFLQAVTTVVLFFMFFYELATVSILLIFLAARGIFQAFQQPAIRALTPIMVPKKHLQRINSADYFVTSIIFLTGPIIAAFLFTFLEIHQMLWIDTATFLIAIIPLIFIKIPKIQKDEIKAKEKRSFFIDFKEGIVFIKEKRGLLSLLSIFATSNLFLIPLFTLINLFIYSTHGGGETELAYVLAFNQAGTIIGSLILIFWKGFKKKVYGVIAGLFLMFVGFIMIVFTPIGLFWFMGIGFLAIGFALPIANISSETIWQSIVPKDKLGRVMSVRTAIAQFTAPLGMILSGLIAEVIPIKYVYLGSAVIGVSCVVLISLFTSMRYVEKGIEIIDTEPDLEASESLSETILDDKKISKKALDSIISDEPDLSSSNEGK